MSADSTEPRQSASSLSPGHYLDLRGRRRPRGAHRVCAMHGDCAGAVARGRWRFRRSAVTIPDADDGAKVRRVLEDAPRSICGPTKGNRREQVRSGGVGCLDVSMS